MKKIRIIALLLAALITLAAAFTGCGKTAAYSEGLEFEPELGSTDYVVTGIGTCEDTELIIPSTYEEQHVKGIGIAAFRNCNYLTSVTIQEGVEVISSQAFANCDSLTSVTIPTSVRGFGEGAFSGCDALTSIHYGGTIAEWKKLPKGYHKFNCTVYCTDGTVQP